MKKAFLRVISKALVIIALIAGISLPSFAGEEADLGNIGKVFRDLRIEKIEYNRELGMYEIRLADSPQPLYMTKDYRYVFIGSVIDVANKRNLTEEKSPKAGNYQKIDFAALPLEKAIKISEGSRKLAVFLDPDCPYSRRIYPELKKLRDVSLHVFFYPLEFHPRAKEKSISAWCAEDRAARMKSGQKGNTSGPEGSNNNSDSIVKKLELEGRHPLRIPPKVVAVWIAPWEDAEGDLHEQEFIYMEITPKEGRWALGEKVVDTRSHRLKRIDDITPANETTEAPGTGNKAGQIKNRTDNRNLPPPGRKEPVFVK